MAEYRLNDLARISGVSARNIRAYRERGLLDPPRRVGRSAYYDDFHLAQLQSINQLLRKGFTSAHIAEFFTSMREGHDLADTLGLQRALLDPRPEAAGAVAERPEETEASGPVAVDIDPQGAEAGRLIELGLADVADRVVLIRDRVIGEIINAGPDQLLYVRAVLRIAEATRATLDELAGEVVRTLEEVVSAQYGPRHAPSSEEIEALNHIVRDCRAMAGALITDQLDEAVRSQMVTAASDYTVGVMLDGAWRAEHR